MRFSILGFNLYFLLLFFSVNMLFGQTNVFPETGNVGVGTITPSANFHINNGVFLLSKDVADSNNKLVNSSSIRFKSTGYAERLRYQYWSVESVAKSYWGSGDLVFFSNTDGGGFLERFRIANTGEIGIGTAAPDSKLTVKGKIHAEEIKVDLSVPAPDYVFKKDYNLISLEEVQHHINEKGHLPNIPSAKEFEENGLELGVMNMKLLEKIEELTLYILELKKENLEQRNEINSNKNLKEVLTEIKFQNILIMKRLKALENK
ncbi:MAG: hypothetical protein ACSHW4_09570 [Cellulophaga sp.]